MNIKNGNLNYDQSGRAYPDDHEMEENWDCIWENEGKYYKIEGYEWTEVSPYDEIVDEAYKNYMNNWPSKIPRIGPCSKEEFINRIKTDDEFSKTWGLKIEGRELSEDERYDLCALQKSKMTVISEEDYIKYNIPTKLITITHNNEKFETYE